MKKLTLYRGLSFRTRDMADKVIHKIKKEGLPARDNLRIPDINATRDNLEALFNSPVSTYQDIYGHDLPWSGCFACGDRQGALFYANNRLNSQYFVVLVTFEVRLKDIYVDCRDFLACVFENSNFRTDSFKPLSIEQEKQLLNIQRSTLSSIYGKNILRYFDACSGVKDSSTRIKMANFASFDYQVAESHYANKITLATKWGEYKSSFVVRVPVDFKDIIECEITTEYEKPDCEIDYRNFYRLPGIHPLLLPSQSSICA